MRYLKNIIFAAKKPVYLLYLVYFFAIRLIKQSDFSYEFSLSIQGGVQTDYSSTFFAAATLKNAFTTAKLN